MDAAQAPLPARTSRLSTHTGGAASGAVALPRPGTGSPLGRDITHVATREGPLLLATLVDVFSRRVVGWAMDDHQRMDLTERALVMALQHRRPAPGLILHHDRGSQYTGARYRAKVETAKMQLSMSRPGMPYDNAMAESFFASLKLEINDGQAFENREAARRAVFEYVELFYNRVRMHSALGYRSPMQAERDYQPVRSVS